MQRQAELAQEGHGAEEELGMEEEFTPVFTEEDEFNVVQEIVQAEAALPNRARPREEGKDVRSPTLENLTAGLVPSDGDSAESTGRKGDGCLHKSRILDGGDALGAS